MTVLPIMSSPWNITNLTFSCLKWDSIAQANLGLRYFQGQGVVQDYIEAHKWFNIAGANGNEEASKSRDIIASIMTPEQIQEAQKLAKEWMANHP
jgi:TPR repeat protein